MKNKIIIFVLTITLNSLLFGFEMKMDSTSRGKTKTEETTKGRSPKEIIQHSYSTDESSCFSTCCSYGLPTLIEILINSDDNPEDGDGNRGTRDSLKIILNPYRFLIGLNLGVSGINTKAKEYEDAGMFAAGSITAYTNNFFGTASYSYSFNNAKPYNDFITTLKLSNGSTQDIEDVLDKSHTSISIISVGVGYQFNLIDDFDGSRLDLQLIAKANYISIIEKSKLTRNIYNNNSLLSSTEISQELNIHKFVPSFGMSINFIPDFNPRLTLEAGFEAFIFKRKPEFLISVPLDWEEFNGFILLGFGIKYEL